jgi:hypothetical protein
MSRRIARPACRRPSPAHNRQATLKLAPSSDGAVFQFLNSIEYSGEAATHLLVMTAQHPPVTAARPDNIGIPQGNELCGSGKPAAIPSDCQAY